MNKAISQSVLILLMLLGLGACQNNGNDHPVSAQSEEEVRPDEFSITVPTPPALLEVPNDGAGDLVTDKLYNDYVAYKKELAKQRVDIERYLRSQQEQVAKNKKLIESQWRWAKPVADGDLQKTYSLGETYFLDRSTSQSGQNSGKLVANYLVDPNGNVIGVKVQESTFDDLQTQALAKGIWMERFKPTGETVSSQRTIVIVDQ